tara:strand:- start:1021 stop:1620 length:600 start_codon:yes stop_codon:yes gene_type:complete
MKNKNLNQQTNLKKISTSIKNSSVTTFTFRKQTVNYFDELIKYNKVSKQKFFEMIIADKSFLENVIKRNQKYHFINDRKIQIRQRIPKNSLFILNKIAKNFNVSRDKIIEKAIQELYENLNKTINENFMELSGLCKKGNQLKQSSNEVLEFIKKNNFLNEAYLKEYNLINKEIKNFRRRVNDDLKHFKIDQWSYIFNEK